MLCALGCGDERPETAQAVSIAAAHADDVVSFQRWAQRIAASDTGFASPAALEEAAFSPIRGDARIAGAWIERRGPDPALFAHPARAVVPPDLAWRHVRVDGLGEVDVATAPNREYVRRSGAAPGGAVLLVTIAFVAEPAPAE